MKTNFRSGVYLALTTALISGLSIYLNKLAVNAMPEAALFTTLKNTLVGLMLLGLTSATRRDVTLTQWSVWQLLVVAVIGGSLPFLLFFKGLALAAAPSAALIHKSLFLWVALLAAPLLGEALGGWTLLGLAALTLGQVLVGWPKVWGWGMGESLILLATLLWAVETIVVKRLVFKLPVRLAATARMLGGALVLWLYLGFTGQAPSVFTLSLTQWLWVLVTSALLFGYVLTWYTALQCAPVTVVSAILPVGAVVTAGLTCLLEGQSLQWLPAMGLGLMIVGVILLVGWHRLERPYVGVARP